jgi:hypothetical protein
LQKLQDEATEDEVYMPPSAQERTDFDKRKARISALFTALQDD